MISVIEHENLESKKYIIAQIELPIEILSDGSFHTHNDHARLQFFKCSKLPPRQDYTNVFLDEVIQNLFSHDDKDIIIKNIREPELKRNNSPVFDQVSKGTQQLSPNQTKLVEDFEPEITIKNIHSDSDTESFFVYDDESIDDESIVETPTEPIIDPNLEPVKEVMTQQEIQYFLSQYPNTKRTHSKNTSFRQYKQKQNHRITSKRIDY